MVKPIMWLISMPFFFFWNNYYELNHTVNLLVLYNEIYLSQILLKLYLRNNTVAQLAQTFGGGA